MWSDILNYQRGFVIGIDRVVPSFILPHALHPSMLFFLPQVQALNLHDELPQNHLTI
jgi:hypothetical protein